MSLDRQLTTVFPSPPSPPNDTVPLVVDIDGTLLRTDLLYESYFSSAKPDFRHHAGVVRSLVKGKAALKEFLAASATLDYASLPLNPSVLDLIEDARAAGRPVYLATASDRHHADALAAQLQLFDGVFASDGMVNLSGSAKAAHLVQTFGEKGFDYVGNSSDDIAVWSRARVSYSIATNKRVEKALRRSGLIVERLDPGAGGTPATWLKAIRVHQWAKNTLILVPLFTAHAFRLDAIVTAVLAFVAFSACASGVYIVNDLLDLQADRAHPRKRNRAFASGALPIPHGLIAAAALFAIAVAVTLFLSLKFTAVLLIYFCLTTGYSVFLKRKMMIDVVMLAMLYTTRVVAGATAIAVPMSEWLLAFSMFIFLSLALMKRYVELRAMSEAKLGDPVNRNYKLDDAPIVAGLAASSGFNAVTIFSLYVASADVQSMYSRPGLLWFICPLLIYWIARSLMMAHRGEMDDDPLVFSMRDRASRMTIMLMLILAVSAA